MLGKQLATSTHYPGAVAVVSLAVIERTSSLTLRMDGGSQDTEALAEAMEGHGTKQTGTALACALSSVLAVLVSSPQSPVTPFPLGTAACASH